MTILIDERVGSKDLLAMLQSLGKPCAFAEGNQQADASFIGNGPDGALWSIGIERKNVNDLVNSIETGRLSGTQLPRMQAEHDIVYVIVEGATRRIWSGDQLGMLEWRTADRDWRTPERPTNWYAVENYLTTLQERAGVRLRQTFSDRGTAATIAALYEWWTEKEYEEHRAHLKTHKGAGVKEASYVVKTLLAWKVRMTEKVARAACLRFDNPRALVNASAAELLEVPGLGKALAMKLEKIFKGELK